MRNHLLGETEPEKKVKQIKFAMWQGTKKVSLSEILAAIPERFDWRILWLYGAGNPFGDCRSFPELEDKIRKAPTGIAISWPDLNALAENLVDLHDILVVAPAPTSEVRISDVRNGDYSSALIAIEGVDDTTWIVTSSDQSILDPTDSFARYISN